MLSEVVGKTAASVTSSVTSPLARAWDGSKSQRTMANVCALFLYGVTHIRKSEEKKVTCKAASES
jgi:hypothetical protein